jgi:hypothetical protein
LYVNALLTEDVLSFSVFSPPCDAVLISHSERRNSLTSALPL